MKQRWKEFGILAVTLLITLAGLFPNVVFCVGENGHHAFEFTAQVCCHPQASTDAGCTSPDRHCSSNCRDLQLVAAALLSKSSSQDLTADSATTVLSIAMLPADSFVRWPSTGVRVRQQPTPFLVVTPRERHTTVQLC